MNYDVITIGSATRDVFLQGNFGFVKRKLCFELGSKNEVDSIFFSTGGGGTNSAATFSSLGFKVACVSEVGNDSGGQAVLKDLDKLNIDNKFVNMLENFCTAYSVIISTKEGRAIFVYRGVSQEFVLKDVSLNELGAKWFYITSLGGNLKLLNDLFAFAGKSEIRLAWNPGSKELKLGISKLKSLLLNAGVLILNLEEAQILTNRKKIKEIFEILINLTNGIVVVTQGNKGVKVCSNKTCYSASALGGKAIERTGAGDAFGSGFVTGLILKNDVEYAIQLGMANASSVVSEIGAKNGLLKKNDLDEFEKVKVENFKL